MSVAIALALGAATPAWAGSFTADSENALIQAIDDANASPGADTISITSDIVLGGALPLISDALTLQGHDGTLHALARDDSGANACSPTAQNAFRLIDASANLTLRDLSLSGGCNLVDQGGAVRVQSADLRIERSTISGNQTFVANEDYLYGAGGLGGGVAVIQGNASLIDSTVSGNATHGVLASGGGIAVYNGNLDLARSTVSGNSASGVGPFGGGVYAMGDYVNAVPGTVTIADSTLSGNAVDGYSPTGGGLFAMAEAVTISNSRITDNTVAGDDQGYARGGGLAIGNEFGEPESLIERTLISGNQVSGLWGFAGGMQVGGGKFIVRDSAIVDNTVTGSSKARAGGIFAEMTDLAILNTTISGNSISGVVNEGGGGMQVITFGDRPMTLLLLNSTVVGNASPNSTSGGILLMRDTAEPLQPMALIESSLIAGNQGIGGFNEIGIPPGGTTSPVVVANNSLIQGAVDVGTGQFAPDFTTTELAGADPLLGPLAANGGPTPTHALLAGSPAIDRGTNLFDLSWDQRGAGHARVVGAAADIGACETNTEVIFADGFD